MVVPLCFALLINLLVDTGTYKDFYNMFALIFNGGAYIFLSLFVLASLIPHFFEKPFEEEESYRSILTMYILITIIVLFITCFLYISFLSFIPSENAISFAENKQTSVIVTLIGIVAAIGFKVKFLILQKTGHISNMHIPD
jgi:Na+/proline symporter